MGIADRISRLFASELKPRPRPATLADLPVTTGGEGTLSIATPDPTAEDEARDNWQRLGQGLVRQDDWQSLSAELRKADAARAMTPGGMSVAELIAFGARADVIGAMEHAFSDGMPAPDAPILDGIEALEDVLEEHASDYAIALIVALTHIDFAWIWRGHKRGVHVPVIRSDAFNAHMDRARDILAVFDDTSLGAPSLLAARCSLACQERTTLDDLSDSFAQMMDLNPMDVRQLRKFGLRLLPSRDGDYTRLELEARRAASRLHDIWGSGGYTWVMFDAIGADEEALAGLDVDHFIQGLRDILALRPDQYTVNLLAAFCSITMSADSGNDAADYNRSRIRKCRDWIVCDYMSELHPLLWAHAAHGFDNNVRVRSVERFAQKGENEARRILNAMFLPELARGQNVTFTENGPAIKQPA